jgi:hypothetical protein
VARGVTTHTVLAGVRRDLAALPLNLRRCALAELALRLGADIDSDNTSAATRARLAGQLREALRELRELAPPAVQTDALDEFSRRREARVGIS